MMSAEIIDINERGRELWEAYLEAKARAEATQDFRDARKAGKLWGRFLDLYYRGPTASATILHYPYQESRR